MDLPAKARCRQWGVCRHRLRNGLAAVTRVGRPLGSSDVGPWPRNRIPNFRTQSGPRSSGPAARPAFALAPCPSRGAGPRRACALSGPRAPGRGVWLRAFGVPGLEVSPVSVSRIMAATCAPCGQAGVHIPQLPGLPGPGRLAEGFRGRGRGRVSGSTGGPWASARTTLPAPSAHSCSRGLTCKLP